jgi:septum formation protein
LLKEIGLDFKKLKIEVDEVFPVHLKRENIALYLSELKMKEGLKKLNHSHELLITADTIVWSNNEVLNKPADKTEALKMLTELSAGRHEVITAFSLASKQKTASFFSVTEVLFKKLNTEEMMFYIDNYKPFDKAGSYGIQEWIGHIGVESINGSYTNVVGLPTDAIYRELMLF